MGEDGRTTVVLVTDYTLRECQEKVVRFIMQHCGDVDSDAIAVVSRHPQNPVVNVGDLGYSPLTAPSKRYNRLAIDCYVYDKPTISAAQWTTLLEHAERQGVRYLFWLTVDPVGDWSPVSPPATVPRDCLPPSARQLWELRNVGRDLVLTAGVELPPAPVSAFTPTPMQLPQARNGKSAWRTPRVSGTQAVTDVAKQASSTVNRCETKGDAKKSS